MGIDGEVDGALQQAVLAVRRGDHKSVGDPEKDFLMHFSAAWVYTTMATIYVSILEKQKRYSEACELLRVLLGEDPGLRIEVMCTDRTLLWHLAVSSISIYIMDTKA